MFASIATTLSCCSNVTSQCAASTSTYLEITAIKSALSESTTSGASARWSESSTKRNRSRAVTLEGSGLNNRLKNSSILALAPEQFADEGRFAWDFRRRRVGSHDAAGDLAIRFAGR